MLRKERDDKAATGCMGRSAIRGRPLARSIREGDAMDPALMTFLVKALHFINIFSAAVVAGGQIYVLLVVIPTKRRFPPELSLQMHNAMLGHLTDRFKKPSGKISAITAII